MLSIRRILEEYEFSSQALAAVGANEYLLERTSSYLSPHVPFHPTDVWRFSIQFRSEGDVPSVVKAGCACYDSKRRHIPPVKVFRNKPSDSRIRAQDEGHAAPPSRDSDLTFIRCYAEDGKEVVEVLPDIAAIQLWKDASIAKNQRFAGFYLTGDTDVLLEDYQLVEYESWEIVEPEREGDLPKCRLIFDAHSISKLLHDQLVSGTTVLINHSSAGAWHLYNLACGEPIPCFPRDTPSDCWCTREFVVSGEGFGLGVPYFSHFRKGTAYIRLFIVANYRQDGVNTRLRFRNFRMQKILMDQTRGTEA